MNRFDPYAVAHTALLAALKEASATCEARSADGADFEAFSTHLQQVFALLDLHSRIEDEVLNPAVERLQLGAAQDNEADHWDLDLEIGEIHELLTAMGTSTAADDAPRQLARALRELVNHCDAHFAREEHELTGLLWQHHSDDELRAMYQDAMAKLHASDLQLLHAFGVTA